MGEGNQIKRVPSKQKAREYEFRKGLEKERAKRRQQASGGDRKSEAARSVPHNLAELIRSQGEARVIAAKAVGMSHQHAERALNANYRGDMATKNTKRRIGRMKAASHTGDRRTRRGRPRVTLIGFDAFVVGQVLAPLRPLPTPSERVFVLVDRRPGQSLRAPGQAAVEIGRGKFDGGSIG